MAQAIPGVVRTITKGSDQRQQIELSTYDVLIVGQQTGSVYTSGDIVTDIKNSSVEITNMGQGSHIGRMVAAFKVQNPFTRVDALVLDDAGGATAATGTVVFSGTATENGTITVVVDSEKNNAYTISILDGETATQIGDKLVTAITDNATSPVTAANVTGTVTCTARNSGTIGNNIGLAYSGTVAGVTTTIAAKLAGGATDPTLTNILDAVGDKRYQKIVWPGNYNLDTVATFTESRFDVSATNSKYLSGGAVITKVDTFSNLETFGDGVNSGAGYKTIVAIGNKIVDRAERRGGAIFENPDIISSYHGAIEALKLTAGQNVSAIVVGADPADFTGGPRLASLPKKGDVYEFLPVIEQNDGFSLSEVDDLEDAGVTVLGNNQSETGIVSGTVVTTYKKDGAGQNDVTYKFQNRVDQMDTFAELLFLTWNRDGAKKRLSSGQSRPGVFTLNDFIRVSKETYLLAASDDYLVTRDSSEDVAFFLQQLKIDLNFVSGTATITSENPFVSQLRRIDMFVFPVLSEV